MTDDVDAQLKNDFVNVGSKYSGLAPAWSHVVCRYVEDLSCFRSAQTAVLDF